jgi:hypothetical protein
MPIPPPSTDSIKTTRKKTATRRTAKHKTKHRVKHRKVKKTSSRTKHYKRHSSPTDKLASNALKWIDQAADLLREGVTMGASQSSHVRNTARKKAHVLLEKAHTSLGEAIDKGTSTLHKMLGKI